MTWKITKGTISPSKITTEPDDLLMGLGKGISPLFRIRANGDVFIAEEKLTENQIECMIQLLQNRKSSKT